MTAGAGAADVRCYLRVEVELICDWLGHYDPQFQVFDETSPSRPRRRRRRPHVETGTLHPGERIRGTIAFDMPHSEATLLMSDDTNQTVTALKVPD